MTDSNDALTAPSGAALPLAAAPCTDAAGASRRVLVIDADRALAGLLDEWLCSMGCSVTHGKGSASHDPVNGNGGSAGANPTGVPTEDRYDLLIVDVPYPRQGGVDSVARLGAEHPKTPILALSSTFFAGIECCGPVARALGVACVLAKPASRAMVVKVVGNLLLPKKAT
jgi:CheY-like chemotaxis protein